LNKLITSVLLCSALATGFAPVTASAASPHRQLVCKATRSAKNTGTIVGALGGGLLGHAVGGGTGGTLVGAGAGAVAGHEIAKHNSAKKHCYYVTRYY
jgi:outer membrane lipoprotein SlyB